MLKRYFSKSFLDLLEDEREIYEPFLKKGQLKDQDPVDKKNKIMPTIEEINYRETIADNMFELRKFKPIDFELVLFQ